MLSRGRVVQSDGTCVIGQAQQVRQKEDALAEKAAYVAKLEWRLLSQQKALQAGHAKKPPLGRPTAPTAKLALLRKPRLAGDLCHPVECGKWQDGCQEICFNTCRCLHCFIAQKKACNHNHLHCH